MTVDEILIHPLFILIVGAGISSFLFPLFTKRWQDHQKELEIKSELVSKISESVMKEVMSVQSIEKGFIERLDVKSEGFKRAFEQANEDYLQWEISSAIIKSQLKAYFSKNISVRSEWDRLSEAVTNFYANIQADYNDAYTNTRNRGIEADWKVMRKNVIEQEGDLVQLILKTRISGF